MTDLELAVLVALFGCVANAVGLWNIVSARRLIRKYQALLDRRDADEELVSRAKAMAARQRRGHDGA